MSAIGLKSTERIDSDDKTFHHAEQDWNDQGKLSSTKK